MERILNNITLINENKFKFVTIRVCYTLPLEYDDIGAFNLLIGLLTSRNNKYPSINLFNSYLESNYGMTIKGGYFNRGNIAVFHIVSTCMNSKYALGEDLFKEQIKLIKDCIFDPFINEETLLEIKNIYIQKLKEQMNKKTYILKKKINEFFGNENPYGVNIESDIKSIEGVSLNKINEVYRKLIDSNSHIYICGDVDIESIENDLADDRFIVKNDSRLDLAYLKDFDKLENNVFESNFLQSAISLIYQCDITYDHKLYYALKVFLEMFNYDLFNVIREKYNFCYYIYAISNNYLNTVEIVSEIESKNLDKIILLIQEILDGYSTNFNTEEFEICKNKIFTYINNTLDSSIDLIDLQFGFDFNRKVNSIEELKQNYEMISVDDVKEVSKMLSLKIVSILKEGTNNG